MNYRNDKYGNPISILGFGCMRFPQKLGKIDMEETEREILEAIRLGGFSCIEVLKNWGATHCIKGAKL